jgi:hypothetical protein
VCGAACAAQLPARLQSRTLQVTRAAKRINQGYCLRPQCSQQRAVLRAQRGCPLACKSKTIQVTRNSEATTPALAPSAVITAFAWQEHHGFKCGRRCGRGVQGGRQQYPSAGVWGEAPELKRMKWSHIAYLTH